MKSLIKEVLNRKDDYEDREITNDQIWETLESCRLKIQVWGVAGMGNNVVNLLMTMGGERAEMIAVNTDSQHLDNVMADKKLLIGKNITRSCNDPKIGEFAAKESADAIKNSLEADLVFIIYGLGGNTSTGAGSVIAKLARDMGALTVAVCTLPFRMEGLERVRNAMEGLKRIQKISNTLIIVPNKNLLHLSSDLTLERALEINNEIIARAVKGITELIMKPQLINLDFADIQRMVADGRIGMIGYGESDNQNHRVEEAVRETLKYPSLCDVAISTAKRALICISGGDSLSLAEAQEAVLKISNQIDPDAEIIWGFEQFIDFYWN
ncbi:MAG: cell division protein FtsZ [Promethearchaeota archaeon]